MKRIFIFTILLMPHFKITAQTFIAPIIGYDFAKIQDLDSLTADKTNVTILENGFSAGSFVIGLSLKKGLTNNLLVSLSFEFTQKKVQAYNFRGIATAEAIKFDYFRNNASIMYKTGQYNFGLGANYNLLGNVNYVYAQKFKIKIVNQLSEKGVKFFLSRSIKSFDVMLYLLKGLNKIIANKEKLHLDSITSMGIQVHYNFSI